MTSDQIVSLIAIFGSLVLVSAGLAGRRLTWSKGLRLGLIWVAIFLIVILFIAIVTGGNST